MGFTYTGSEIPEWQAGSELVIVTVHGDIGSDKGYLSDVMTQSMDRTQ